MRMVLIVIALVASPLFAQGDFAPPPPKDDPNQIKTLKPLPANTILLPGALPSASDSKTPLPESGNIHKNVYENRYFGMAYTFPEKFFQEFDGPPPSDSGKYVLAELTLKERGSILITAQDDFFGERPTNHLASYYKAEDSPVEMNVGSRKFERFDYMSPGANLHWSVLSTEIRCHTVQFVFTSRDTALLADLRDGLTKMIVADADAPRCVPDYARGDNVIYKVDPVLSDRKFNPIPVRIVIGKNGKVQHVHVISAFGSQAPIVIDALLHWRFKPYLVNGEPVEIETGVYFGSPKTRSRAPGIAAAQ
ncbi:MAG TPA: hypothetical protein VI391_03095 [Thermoanaerobaculia bacterium]